MKCPDLFFVSLVVFIPFIYGCEKEDILPSNLPVNYSDSIYNINNREAAARVLTIKMGNLGGSGAKWYNRFLITHISDSHVSYMSPDNCVSIDKTISCKNLKESIRFSNQLKPGSTKSLLDINCIVSTGDMISNWKNDSKRAALNRLDYFMTFFNENNKIPSVLCTGNHDSGFFASDTSAYLNKEDIYNAVTKRINTPVNGLQGENYFYKDISNPAGGTIRFISLDVLDQTGILYNTLYDATYSQKQIDWLCNTALKEGLTAGHSIIILNHFPYPSAEFVEKTQYIPFYSYTHNRFMIPEIVEAFRKKETLVKTYPPSGTYINNSGVTDISVNADFSSAPGEFICYLGGHVHMSIYFRLSGYSNISSDLKPQLMILCTNQAPNEIGLIYNKVYREINSITSNAFQIYAVDTKEGNIYMTYFGPYIPVDDPQKPEIEKINYR